MNIIVPSEAAGVLHIDVEKNLNTDITPLLLDLVFMLQNGDTSPGQKDSAPQLILDEQLIRLLGIRSVDIQTLNLFLLSFDMSVDTAPSGIHMVCKEGVTNIIKQHIHTEYSPDIEKHGETSYLVFRINNHPVYVHITGDNLLLSSDRTIMEKMLNVINNRDSVRENQYLYQLLKQYSEHTFYFIGSLQKQSDTPLPPPFEPVKEFGLTITLDKDVSFLFKGRLDNTEEAENFIISVKGSVALTSMVILAQYKEAYPILMKLIQKIKYEQNGSYALISGTFTEVDINMFKKLAPVLFMMM